VRNLELNAVAARRVRVIRLLAVLSLSWVLFALASRSMTPSVARPAAPPPRGQILAAGGEVLARSVDGRRVYPYGRLAGALLGFEGADAGLEGLEFFYQDALARGEDLRLSVDVSLQTLAEEVLNRAVVDRDAEWGAAAILDVRSGRVLALASAAPFNPGTWRTQPASGRRNRPLVEQYEPGSVMKALVVSALINEGRTTPTTRYDTPMRRRVGAASISDLVTHPARLNTQGILQYSSNVGMTRLVDGVPPELLARYFQAFGFGTRLSLGPVFNAPGRVGSPASWGTLGQATRAFGQGLSVNTLQLAAAFNTIANDGLYRTPTLVLGEAGTPARRVLQPETARTVQGLLHVVVDRRLPTSAAWPGYHTAGKTGTAQIAIGGQYSDTTFMSTFAGFFPARQPRVTIAVAVRGARRQYQGSQLAAPVFRDLAIGLASAWSLVPDTTVVGSP